MFKLTTTSLGLVLALTAGSAFAQSGMTGGGMPASPMAKMSKADRATMDKCKMMKPDAMAKSMSCKKVMAMAAPMATPAPMAPAGSMSGAMSGTMKPETPMKK
jgi:hypothetical protein